MRSRIFITETRGIRARVCGLAGKIDCRTATLGVEVGITWQFALSSDPEVKLREKVIPDVLQHPTVVTNNVQLRSFKFYVHGTYYRRSITDETSVRTGDVIRVIIASRGYQYN